MPIPNFATIAGQFPAPATLTDSGASDAPVGGCVYITGTQTQANLYDVDCSSNRATYKVIQRVVTPDQCVGDRDRPFYYNNGHDEWTACMDINWDSSTCINIDAVVTKVACDDPNAHNKIKPVSVILDSTTVDPCASGGGYAHPARHFTICTQSLG